MPNFKYKAINADGQPLESTLVAADEKDVIRQLQKMKMTPVSVAEEQIAAPQKQFRKKIKTKHILLFTKQLYTLLRSGIPILTSLNAIKEQTADPAFKQMIETVAREVEQGSSFSSALEPFPKIFPRIYINSVKVGEVSGTLEETLVYLYQYMEEEEKIRQNVKKALRYPAMVILGLIAAFFVVTSTVLPQFIPIFETSSVELPLPTRILIGFHDLLSAYGWFVAIVLAGLIAGFIYYKRTPKGRFQVDLLMLNLPVLGELIRKVSISRFTKIFYTMNRTGLSVINAFEVMQETLENEVYRRELRKILDHIKQGAGIANSLKRSAFFSPFVVEMIAIGEKSGSLDEMLNSVSQYYDLEVTETVDKMTSMIEPLVTVALGGMVLVLALAIFLPLWDLMGIVK